MAGDGVERFVTTPEQRMSRTERDLIAHPKSLHELVSEGESETLEFKSSFRWDHEKRNVNTELLKAVTKGVAAMLNSEGGTVLVGVKDDGTPLGIEPDLKTLKRSDTDECERALRQGFINYLGVEFSPYVRVTFPELDGVQICRVDIEASPKAVFMNANQRRDFYIRSGNASRPLDPAATHEYIEMHWAK